MSQVPPRQDLTTILEYRQLHLPVFVRSPSFELWQLFRFGAGFADLVLLVLMVFVEPLLTALQKSLQPSAALVLTLFLLMMMIVYWMLSFLSRSSYSSSPLVCCFCCYCCYYGIILPFIVVEIIHDLSLTSANTMDKRLPAAIVEQEKKQSVSILFAVADVDKN